MDTGQIWIGRKIGGRYQLESQLGRGGMAIVYRATDMNLRRDVAIKIIHPHLTDNAEFVKRFEQEAAAIAQLRHGHIVKVFDFSQDSGVYYMVMEYIRGDTLAERLATLKAAGTPLPLNDIIDLMLPICQAVDYAHQRRLIHRDIKPANILIDALGRPTLMDFGIAKIITGPSQSITGAAAGTAAYMAPELFQKGKYDHRVDIYSLGIVLFEMLSGAPPFTGDSTYAVIDSHLNQPLPDLSQLDPGLPQSLVAVVQRALAKGPVDRYQNVQEMTTDLEQFRQEQIGPQDAATQRLSRLHTLLQTAETAAADERAADALALLMEIREIDKDFEEEAVTALYKQLVSSLVTSAQTAVSNGNYQKTEAHLAALQAFAPDNPAIPDLVDKLETGRQRAAIQTRLDSLYEQALDHLSRSEYKAALTTYRLLQQEAAEIDYVDRMQVKRRAKEGISQQRYRAASTALAAGHPEEAMHLWQQLKDENPDFVDENKLQPQIEKALARHRRRRPLLIGGAAILAILLVVAAISLFTNDERPDVAAAIPSTLATETPIADTTADTDTAVTAATTILTSTATAPAPTATLMPTPSPAATVTPLPTAASVSFPDRLATIAEPSSIYSAPNGAARELAVVGIDETVTVLGRSESSTWLFVRNRDGVAGFIFGRRVLWDGDWDSLPVRQPLNSSNTAVPTAAPSVGPLEFDLWPLVGTVRCNTDGSWTQQIYFNSRGGSGRYTYFWDDQRLAGPLGGSYTYTIRSDGAAVTGEGRVTSGDGQAITSPLFIPRPNCD